MKNYVPKWYIWGGAAYGRGMTTSCPIKNYCLLSVKLRFRTEM